MIDSLKFRQEEKKSIRRKKEISPDLGKIEVYIDPKTSIWIRVGQDPEERKQAFLKRLDRYRNNPDNL